MLCSQLQADLNHITDQKLFEMQKSISDFIGEFSKLKVEVITDIVVMTIFICLYQ